MEWAAPPAFPAVKTPKTEPMYTFPPLFLWSILEIQKWLLQAPSHSLGGPVQHSPIPNLALPFASLITI